MANLPIPNRPFLNVDSAHFLKAKRLSAQLNTIPILNFWFSALILNWFLVTGIQINLYHFQFTGKSQLLRADHHPTFITYLFASLRHSTIYPLVQKLSFSSERVFRPNLLVMN